MQIQNQLSTSQTRLQEKGLLKIGDMLKGTVKEVISNNEALVQVNGKNMKMKLDQSVKVDQQVHVQVKQMTGDMLDVKMLASSSEQASARQSTNQMLTQLGADLSNQPLKQALTGLADQGYPLTRENVKQVDSFLKDAPGTIQDKLETIEAMGTKKLEMTPVQLKAVHEALHGDGMKQFIKAEGQDISLDKETVALIKKALADFVQSNQSNTPGVREKVEQLQQKLEKSLNIKDVFLEVKQLLGKSAANEMEKSLKIFHTGQERFVQALKASSSHIADVLLERLQQQSLLKMGSESIQALLKQSFPPGSELDTLMNTLDESLKLQDIALKQFLQQLKSSLTGDVEASGLPDKIEKMIQKEPNVDKLIQFVKDNLPQDGNEETSEKLAARLAAAEQLAAEQKELGARKELHALAQLLREDGVVSTNLPYDEVNPVSGMSKDMIVTTITKKLAQAAEDFKLMQRDAVRQLQTVEQAVETSTASGRMQANRLLETVIKNLDQAIMKSDFMLYADMKTEKSMLEASTLLQQAKKLLAKGEMQESLQIVKQVKTMVQEATFKPSDTKMVHMVKGEWGNASPVGTALSMMNGQDGSGRQVLEMMRQLGLNREHDIASQLTSKQAVQQQDVKSALLQLAGEHGKMPGQIEQALQHVTGQQLLSKQDSQGNLQHMFFQLPYLLQDEVKDVKVYVNSQKQHEKMDWENCSLYFLFETKKLGNVGILLNAVDRKLSITFKNDDETFPQKTEELAGGLKEKISDIGYIVSGVQHQPLQVRKEETNEEEKATSGSPNFAVKGFDYSI